ncbi:hypothetical protein F2Q68_00020078 [Brassica cretica]|uniref:TIR domain-containing protein n=1 Tax=Brassica cretica TaxID=69181 RepID=A0A8S9FQF1_BRACR|nr:hypothetical protein F2Q68_00020078 [Brassica cretica]
MATSSSTVQHDVFIAFSSRDTRYSFVSHLSAAFRRSKISFFVGDAPEEAEAVAVTEAAIEGSKVFVVVFSENYAFSRLSLDTLVKIMERKHNDDVPVVPIFYGDVTSTVVKCQTKRFGEAFSEHRSLYSDQITKWQNCLIETASLSGHESICQPVDSELVKEIVADVREKLIPTGLVGFYSRFVEIENLLWKQSKGYCRLGIWGMPGIGKTTIAQAAFDLLSPDFEVPCFLKDFHASFHEKGSYKMREDHRVEMHSLVQEVGREIANRETKLISRRRRLWEPSSIINLLLEDKESKGNVIEGIFLDTTNLNVVVNPMAFENMYILRLLKIYSSSPEAVQELHLPNKLHYLPYELRLLHWEKYPLKSLPQEFDPSHLVELNMPYSRLKNLWGGTKERFPESKTILVVIDDVRNARDAEALVGGFDWFSRGHLIILTSRNRHVLVQCKVKEDYPPNLKDLYLAGTAIREITSSLGKLTILDLLQYIWRIVTSFLQLPLGISMLKAMLTLKLSGCSKLKSLPNLDATILSGSGHLNTETTMEVPAAIMVHHSTIQDSRPGECETPLINLQHKPENPDLF